jgi:hypothetical protein
MHRPTHSVIQQQPRFAARRAANNKRTRKPRQTAARSSPRSRTYPPIAIRGATVRAALTRGIPTPSTSDRRNVLARKSKSASPATTRGGSGFPYEIAATNRRSSISHGPPRTSRQRIADKHRESIPVLARSNRGATAIVDGLVERCISDAPR